YKAVTDQYATLVGGGAGAFDDPVKDQLSDNDAARIDAQLAGRQWAAEAWQAKDNLESHDYKKANEALGRQRQYAEQDARRDTEARFDVEQRTEDWGKDKTQVAAHHAAL